MELAQLAIAVTLSFVCFVLVICVRDLFNQVQELKGKLEEIERKDEIHWNYSKLTNKALDTLIKGIAGGKGTS